MDPTLDEMSDDYHQFMTFSIVGYIIDVPLNQVFDMVSRRVGDKKAYGRANLKVKVIKAISANVFLIADATGSYRIETYYKGWRGYEYNQCQNKKNIQESSYVLIRNLKVDLTHRKLYLDVFTNIYIVKPFPIGNPASLADDSKPNQGVVRGSRRPGGSKSSNKSKNTKFGCFCVCLFVVVFISLLFVFKAF